MVLNRRRVQVRSTSRSGAAAGAIGRAVLVGYDDRGPTRPGGGVRIMVARYRVEGETELDRQRLAGRVFLEEELELVPVAAHGGEDKPS